MDKSFNVLDMVDAYQDETGSDDIDELFTKPEPKVEEPKPTIPEPTPEPPAMIPESKEKSFPSQVTIGTTGHKSMWVPKGMEDFQKKNAPVYKKEEVKFEPEKIKNGADEELKMNAATSMGEIERQHYNIEKCKERRGYLHLHIPDGPYYTKLINAASDPDTNVAQSLMDPIFDELEELYPEVIEWKEGYGPKDPELSEEPISNETNGIPDTTESKKIINLENTDYQLRINVKKDDLDKIAWTKEEAEKIRKARSIQLNIMEQKDVPLSQIQEADVNMVDKVLEKYQSRVNDRTAPLPASKYRATFTGLSYPEILDLENSTRINTLDGEKKLWTIAFLHTKNPSIGEWQEYYLYKDPDKHLEVRIESLNQLPSNIDPHTVHFVSKYEDFLRKTSYIDLHFIIWNILCATSMEKETISITCHRILKNGRECGTSHFWVYRPDELLEKESVPDEVKQEMDETAAVTNKEEIQKCYQSSLLVTDNLVDLTKPGMKLIFGHISAYEYLEHVYFYTSQVDVSDIQEAMESDPEFLSKFAIYNSLVCVKGILLDVNGDQNYTKITGVENIIRVMKTFNEIDFGIVQKVTDLSITPYQFQFSIRNIICPKCKQKSDAIIEDVSDLLFSVAQSIASVQVELMRV